MVALFAIINLYGLPKVLFLKFILTKTHCSNEDIIRFNPDEIGIAPVEWSSDSTGQAFHRLNY